MRTESEAKAPALVAVVCAEKEVLELLANFCDVRIVGVFDRAPEADTLGFEHLGDDANWSTVRARYPDLQALIALDAPKLKEKLSAYYGRANLFAVRSPLALVSPSSSLGEGHVIQHGVKVFARARVGLCAKLNVDATVHHDCIVGDFCTLAPGARLLGAAQIGNRVFVGASATVLPHVQVADDCTIGAGAVVTRSLPSGITVVGVPARPVQRARSPARP